MKLVTVLTAATIASACATAPAPPQAAGFPRRLRPGVLEPRQQPRAHRHTRPIEQGEIGSQMHAPGIAFPALPTADCGPADV
jgi:hypothetical protein